MYEYVWIINHIIPYHYVLTEVLFEYRNICTDNICLHDSQNFLLLTTHQEWGWRSSLLATSQHPDSVPCLCWIHRHEIRNRSHHKVQKLAHSIRHTTTAATITAPHCATAQIWGWICTSLGRKSASLRRSFQETSADLVAYFHGPPMLTTCGTAIV